MSILLALAVVALVATKAADVVTTWKALKRVGIEGEQNPLARRIMRSFGLGGGIAVVMILWCLIVALCFVPAFFAPTWYQLATALGGLIVAWVQWDVARYNATHVPSNIVRLLQKGLLLFTPRG